MNTDKIQQDRSPALRICPPSAVLLRRTGYGGRMSIGVHLGLASAFSFQRVRVSACPLFPDNRLPDFSVNPRGPG